MSIKDSFDKIVMPEDMKNGLRTQVAKAAEEAAARKLRRRRALRMVLPAAAALALVVVAAAVIGSLVREPGTVSAQSGTPVTETADAATPTVLALETTPEPQKKVGVLVTLSINPEVEFNVDEDGMIIEVTGKNDDGAELIKDVDFTGMSFENAAITVVNLLIRSGYITAESVDRSIFLSVGGEGGEGLLEVLADTIRSAAAGYEMDVDTVQTGEEQLQLVIREQPQDNVNALQKANPNDLPLYMQVDIQLSGFVNTPETRYWDAANRIFYAGVTELDSVVFTFGNGEQNSGGVLASYELGGGNSIAETVMTTLAVLDENGYITRDMPGKLVIALHGGTEEQFRASLEMARLVVEDLGNGLEAVPGSESGTVVISSSAEPFTAPEHEYTLSQLLNTLINKDAAKVTELQMRILSLATEERYVRDELLRPRFWTVMPDLIGLTEEEAVRLCEQNGINYWIEHMEFTASADTAFLGRVQYQDMPAGSSVCTDWQIQLEVQDAA
ncbi:MAG: hypothetical protein II072_09890 [Clostridia bacterium]|nr:hypothetical protein [Clostridia bacterium]